MRLLAIIAALSLLCCAGVSAQGNLAGDASPPGISIKWDPNAERIVPSFFGYFVYYKVGLSGGSPYNGTSQEIGQPAGVSNSPIPLLHSDMVLSGTTEDPTYRFETLVDLPPGAFTYAVVTAAEWVYVSEWDPVSGTTKQVPDKTGTWDPDAGVTVYNVLESDFSNEVKWGVRDGKAKIVWAPIIDSLRIKPKTIHLRRNAL